MKLQGTEMLLDWLTFCGLWTQISHSAWPLLWHLHIYTQFSQTFQHFVAEIKVWFTWLGVDKELSRYSNIFISRWISHVPMRKQYLTVLTLWENFWQENCLLIPLFTTSPKPAEFILKDKGPKDSFWLQWLRLELGLFGGITLSRCINNYGRSSEQYLDKRVRVCVCVCVCMCKLKSHMSTMEEMTSWVHCFSADLVQFISY